MQIQKQQAQIEQLLEENEQLRAEIRHLKKQKGKPKIRPNVTDGKGDQEHKDSQINASDQRPESNGNNTPSKSKRPRSQQPGETSAPPLVADKEETLRISDPEEGWRFKGYANFHHTELDFQFITTLYRREYYQTPEGIVTAPLPEHIKGRFGDNLKSHLLNFYHSCSTTQPLLLDWLHDHGCPISEGSLNNILMKGHAAFHQEKEEILEDRVSLFRLSSGG